MENFRICLYLSFVIAAYSYHANNVQHMEIIDSGNHNQKVIDIGARGRKGGLTYSPCNVTAVPMYWSKLYTKLDTPIKYGDRIDLVAELYVSENITGKIRYEADIQVKINGEYDSLCDLLQGYCTGDDICKYLEKVPFRPLTCPVPKKFYNFTMPKIQVPKFQFTITGDFNITLKLYRGQEQIMCANVRFCLENCDS